MSSPATAPFSRWTSPRPTWTQRRYPAIHCVAVRLTVWNCGWVKVENVAQMLKSLIEWRNPAREDGNVEEGASEENAIREKVFGASRNRSLQLIVITHVRSPL